MCLIIHHKSRINKTNEVFFAHLSKCILYVGRAVMEILERIKQLRDERGWSNYRLAKEADISEKPFDFSQRSGAVRITAKKHARKKGPTML